MRGTPQFIHLRIAFAPAMLTSLAVLLMGCSGAATQSRLTARASQDMTCPQNDLSTETLVDAIQRGKKVRVTGCGKETVYVRVCDSDDLVANCGWAVCDGTGLTAAYGCPPI